MQYTLKNIVLSTLFLFILYPAHLWGGDISIPDLRTIDLDFITNTFIQDSDGFIWIGGVNGLYKYDGYRTKKVSSQNFTASKSINALFEDSSGKIWIGAFNGITVYDKETDTFTHFQHDPDNPKSIGNGRIGDSKQQIFTEDQNHNIWIGTDRGLNKFSPETRTFTRFQTQWIDNDIWSVYVDKTGALWVGTAKGLHRFDPKTETVKATFLREDEKTGEMGGRQICSILEDSRGTFWVGTMANGLSRMEKDAKAFVHYSHHQYHNRDDLNRVLGNSGVTSIMEDRKGNLWISTIEMGILRFDDDTQMFSRPGWYKERSDFKEERNFTTIRKSHSGEVWFSSYKGKLYYLHSSGKKFNPLVHDHRNPNSLGKGDYVGQVLEDGEGMLWIAIGSFGLDRYDRLTNTFTHYTMDNAGLPEAFGQSLFLDIENNLWLTTRNHIVLFDRKKEMVSEIYAAENWPCSPVRDPVDPDIIWYGTWGSGLLKFNRKTGERDYISADPSRPDTSTRSSTITALYPDGNMIWLCTRGGGLKKFDPQTTLITRRYLHDPADDGSISSNSVHGMIKDSKGRYWITTDSGLDRFNSATERFKRHHVQNNLSPVTTASQIIEDPTGQLWVSGFYERKIVQYDPESGRYTVYERDDGIVPNIGGSYKPIQTRDGTLWFYGGGGIVYFRPGDIEENSFVPPVFLTSLTQGGAPIDVGQALERTQFLELNWRHNYFEFEVAALNYYHAQHNQYRYKMSGIDRDWFHSGNLRKGRYTGITPGKYVLTIEGSNNDGVWSDNPVRLNVTVIPPWWRTWWFRTLMGVAFVCIGFLTYTWRLNLLRYREKALEREVLERTKEVRERTKSLKKSEQRFSFVTNSISAIMYVSDMNTYEVLFINDYTRKIFGNVEGKKCWQALQYDQDGPCSFCTNSRLVRDGKSTGIYAWEFQNSKTGQWYHIQDQAIRWIDGRLVRMEIATDISRLKEIEKELIQAKTEAESANQAKSTFLANMSHELRTPLSTILGYAGILKKNTLPEHSRHVDIILQSGKHLLSLIEDLLDLAKIESGNMALLPDDFDLMRFLKTVVDMIKTRCEEEGLAFKAEFSQALPTDVRGDALRLRQVLLNLLSNAVKFTNKGGVTLRVTPLFQTSGSTIRFEVEDTGVGISKDDRNIIFEPFQQAGIPEKQVLGSGLGLTVCRKLVKQMGGELVCLSAPGGMGSLFRFDLNLPHSSKKAANETAYTPQIVRVKGISPKILVVDDNVESRQLLHDTLAPLHFEVTSAENGEEALKIAKTFKPDAVLTDLQMPGLDGFELIESIRSSQTLKDMVIMIVSANAFQENKERCIALGADDFLPKPFDTEKLMASLQRHLGFEWVQTMSPKGYPVEKHQPQNRQSENHPLNGSQLPSEVAVPSIAVLKELQNAAQDGHIMALRTHLDALYQTHPAFARNLRTLLNQFRLKEMKDILKECIG